MRTVSLMMLLDLIALKHIAALCNTTQGGDREVGWNVYEVGERKITVRDYRREKRHGERRGQVGYYLARSGYSKRELAVKLGMGNATLYSKLRNPNINDIRIGVTSPTERGYNEYP